MTKVRDMSEEEFERAIDLEVLDKKVHELNPEDKAPLLRYLHARIAPGSFLLAILQNDLKEAVGRADRYHRRRIPEFVSYLYNNVPSNCWGSPEAVADWLAGKDFGLDEPLIHAVLGDGDAE